MSEGKVQRLMGLEALAAWAEGTVPKLSRKSELAAAFRYMRARWIALTRCLEDSRLASTTTRPSAPCAASPSAARTISLPDLTQAGGAPRRCTR
jgi:hypothetical protein